MFEFSTYKDKIAALAVTYLPKLFLAILALVIGLWLIKRVAKLSEKAMAKRELDVSLRTFLRSLISVGLKVMLLISVAGMIGFQTTSLVAVLGAAGLAVGLALQGSLANFAGGVLIMVFKPYRVGDTIEVQGQTGEVKEIQIFNTIMLTGQNKTVIMPNGAVSNGYIVNYSRQGSIRCDINVNVAYGTNLDTVRRLAAQVFAEEERILKTPEPFINPAHFGADGITLHVRLYTAVADSPLVYYSVTEKLLKAFAANGIEVPAPIKKI